MYLCFFSLVLLVNVMPFLWYSTLMPMLDLISLMHLPLYFCIDCVLDMQMIFCIKLILLACLDVHSLCGWSLWLLFIMIVHVCSSHALLLQSLLLDRILLVPNVFQDFCLQWSSCVIVFRKTCLFGSRASQFLELGVSEFW